MKYTRPVRTIVLLLLLLVVLFSPALARSAQSALLEPATTTQIETPVKKDLSVASQHTFQQTEVVLYQRVIAELVKTFYIA